MRDFKKSGFGGYADSPGGNTPRLGDMPLNLRGYPLLSDILLSNIFHYPKNSNKRNECPSRTAADDSGITASSLNLGIENCSLC